VQREVSIIVPARNEEASLARCLQSLTRQTGVSFEILVVNDGSTDRTPEIPGSFSGVRVIDAPEPASGWNGKSNAMSAGAKEARSEWLLFTDADTVHCPGSLARSLAEAKQQGAALLSYSPEQEVHGFCEKAVLPVIFAELAGTYQASEVSDPASPVAAANGQYLLISREAYDAVGGLAAATGSLLEDVALAQAVKRSGRKLYFRFGGDAVRTRMYRSFAQMREGWTKNLALLFPKARRLAALRLSEFLLIAGGMVFTMVALLNGATQSGIAAGIVTVSLYGLFLRRIFRAHFSWDSNLLAIFGLPLFAYLLMRSTLSHKKGTVTWKGRVYRAGSPDHEVGAARAQHCRRDADATPGQSWSI
jgi:molybdopterin-guanine dinucleotide biosynthesis protein A